MRRPAVLLLACALAVRCGGDTPALTAVEPSSGPSDRAVAIVIHGQALEPRVDVDVGCDGHATTNDQFAANVGTTALSGVAWQSGDVMATVPAGLAPGTYDVSVITPQGANLVLPQAYTVLPPGTGDDGGSNDGGTDGGPNCETLYANAQAVMGNVMPMNPDQALGAPDGQVGIVRGQFSNRMASWTFRFSPGTLAGNVTTSVSVVMAVAGGYVDDRLVIEVSSNAASSFMPLASFGTPDPLPPTTLMDVGPYSVPGITQVPSPGQLVVRIRGNGTSGPADNFDLQVDAVSVRFCEN